MDKSIQEYLGSLQLGEIQQFKNLAMVPVVSDYDDGLVYITIGEALGAGSIEIREVSEGGSVPELRVVNRAGKMVLILDGEELVGAKQNRIVDTTILVAAGAEIVIPVSCVEQGRWTYKSDVFSSKQRVMSLSIRQVKATYGEFTSEAREFAKANSIALIDGPKLTQMIASVQQNGNIQAQQEVVRTFPKCSSEKVLFMAKKGLHLRKNFWGCSKFPDCRGVDSAKAYA